MSNNITNRQVFFILVMTLTTYTTISLPKVVAEEVGTSGWITILIAAIFFGGMAVIITTLNNLYPGKAIYDYSREISGGFVARAITVYYILYFAVVCVNLKIKLVTFLQSNFLPKTPQYIMLAVSVTLFGYVSYKGITNVARLFEMFGIVFLITTITLCVVMLTQGMLYNILPLFNPLEAKQVFTSMPYLIFPYGGIEVLLVIPFTRENKKAPAVSFFTLLFIGAFYVLLVEGTISILGISNTILYNDTFIEAIKIVQIPVLERPDLFYLTVGLTSLFAGMIIVYAALIEHIIKLFPKLGRKKTTVSTGVLLYTFCLLAFNVKDLVNKLEEYLGFPVLVSCFIIPGALLVAAKIQKKAKGRS